MKIIRRATLGALAAALIAVAAFGGQARAATPFTLRLASTPLGTILVDPRGHSLYLFAHDKSVKSTCYGACATDWPPLLTAARPRGGAGVKASLLGTTRRKDGRLQVTYHGHPLYAFSLDKQAGQTNGQRVDFFGGEWYVVGANGIKLEAKQSGNNSGGTSSGGGGNYGGGAYGGG